MVRGNESIGLVRELFTAAVTAKSPVKYLSELRRVSDLVTDKAVADALQASRMLAADKIKLVAERAGGLSSEVSVLLADLINHGRLAELGSIVTEYQRLLDAYHGVEGAQVAEVTTAVPLDDEARLSLGKKLTEMLGKPIVIQANVDPGVIGGIIIRIGDKLVDGSIRSRLQAISKELTV